MIRLLGWIVLAAAGYAFWLHMQDDGPRITSSISAPAANINADAERQAQLASVRVDVIRWTKGGFGTVALTDLRIKNGRDAPIRDIAISCQFFAPSGTMVGNTTQTVYRSVAAGKTISVKDLNLGFVHSQAIKMACQTAGFASP